MKMKVFLTLVLTIFALSIFIIAAPVGDRAERGCHKHCSKKHPTSFWEYADCMEDCMVGASL